MAKHIAESMETMYSHMSILRNYARLAIEQDIELTWAEQEEKAYHLKQYMALGSSLKWSQKELVSQLLREAICP